MFFAICLKGQKKLHAFIYRGVAHAILSEHNSEWFSS